MKKRARHDLLLFGATARRRPMSVAEKIAWAFNLAWTFILILVLAAIAPNVLAGYPTVQAVAGVVVGALAIGLFVRFFNEYFRKHHAYPPPQDRP
jgi:hypothetical protein